MRIRYFLVAVLLSVLTMSMTSCYTYSGEVHKWIASAPQNASHDFSGRWQVDTEALGWVPSQGSRMFLTQDSARLAGSFEGYDLLGVANGDALVLFGLREDAVYFTWHLKYSTTRDAFLGKQVEGASRAGAHFAIIVGDELDSGHVQVKDLQAGTQRQVDVTELARDLARAQAQHRHGEEG